MESMYDFLWLQLLSYNENPKTMCHGINYYK